MASLVVVAVAVIAGLFMAWALGASSNSPPFAPAVGANALSTMRAALFIGVFAGLGAVAQGASISETVGRGLIEGVAITPLAAAVALLTGAALIVTGVYTGYPIPSAFAVAGAVVGVGLALGGDPAYGTYTRITAFWLAIPPVAGGIAYVTAVLLRREGIPESVAIPMLGGAVGVIVANMSMSVVPAPDGQGSIAGVVSRALGGAPTIVGSYDVAMLVASLGLGAACFVALRWALRRSLTAGTRAFLVGLGALVAFSSGGSQVGLATGPLESVFEQQLGLPPIALLLFGGVGILLGAWMGSPRLLQAVAREYSALGIRRSIAALVPGFAIAQAAIALGIPISFNQIIVSSVIGSGLVEGSAGVSGRKIGVTAAAWVATLVAAGALGYVLYTGLAVLPGVT
jgi:phosphate/sulfate permease